MKKPKKGMRMNSLREMKQLSVSRGKAPKMSNMHWCFEAISAAPVGMYWRPRTSTLMSQITRSSQVTDAPQLRITQTAAPRGMNMTGVAPIATKADQM